MACSTRNTSPRTSAFKSICRTPALKTSTSSFIGRRVKTKRRSTSTERAPAVVQHRMLDDGVFLYSSKSSPKELRLASTERRRASSASERSDSTSRSAGERPPAVDARRSRMCSSDRSNVWSVAARFVTARFTGASLRSPSTAARSLLPPVVLFGGFCRSSFIAPMAFPASSSCLKMAFSLANSLARVSWRGFICGRSASIRLSLASSLARSSASNLARSAASSASAAS